MAVQWLFPSDLSLPAWSCKPYASRDARDSNIRELFKKYSQVDRGNPVEAELGGAGRCLELGTQGSLGVGPEKVRSWRPKCVARVSCLCPLRPTSVPPPPHPRASSLLPLLRLFRLKGRLRPKITDPASPNYRPLQEQATQCLH